MKIIEQSFECDSHQFDGALEKIEVIARDCYQSQDKIGEGTAEKMCLNLIKNKHEAMLEFVNIHVRIVTDRGVTHELVRHRIASYAQESTRYCNYGGGITVIKPVYWEFCQDKYGQWEMAMKSAEAYYLGMLERGASPQEARAVLPNSLKTVINVGMNIREWRHFFRLRCAKSAHPQMRDIAQRIHASFIYRCPTLFKDIEYA